jgi:molybdate transport system ATP-binding protein
MSLQLQKLLARLPEFNLELDIVLDRPMTGLFGPSGAGKTTLLETIAGLRNPDAGRIVFDQQIFADTATGTALPPHRRRIGYVPQDVALFPHLHVRRNLLYGWHSRGGDGLPPHWDETIEMMELADLIYRPIAGLSGGERQRVALARAILSSARLWLLDEPLASLDQPVRRRLLGRLRQWVDRLKITAIYVSHDPAEIADGCDDVLVMKAGKLVQRGLPGFVAGLPEDKSRLHSGS